MRLEIINNGITFFSKEVDFFSIDVDKLRYSYNHDKIQIWHSEVYYDDRLVYSRVPKKPKNINSIYSIVNSR